jgi:4-amino-4-deoxy-L-arabinose transferase-like glycosyltransferase
MPKRISPATHAALDALLVGALLLGGSLLWHCYRRLRGGRRTEGWRLRGWESLGIGA